MTRFNQMKSLMFIVWVVFLFGGAQAGRWTKFRDKLQREAQRIANQTERFVNKIEPALKKAEDDAKEWLREDINSNTSSRILEIPDPPPGVTTCSPLVEPSLELDCHLEGVAVNCSEPMAVGTVAQMRCQEAYVFLEYPGYNFVTCTSTHVWSQPVIKCVADCGKRNSVGGSQLVSNGERAEVSEFSWHVGIYRLNKTNLYRHICGGTLITRSLVMSAAHCFWNMTGNKPLNISSYAVAAGKYHRDWYIEDKETQKRELADLYIHERFNGLKRNLAYDIAIIRVTEEFKLTWAINTICMDYPNAFEDIHLRPGNNGTIAGWGITENNTQSDVLMSVQLPYVDYLECGDLVAVPFQKFLTDDKICAGFVGHNTAVCPGDSGGGYVFPHNTVRGIRYYLRGIVSAGHVPAELWRRCATEDLSAFTLVSKHRNFVEQHVFNKSGVAP